MVVILSPDALSGIRLEVDEFFQADLPEGFRYELVDGVVEVTPIPGMLHDDSMYVLLKALFAYLGDHPEAFRHLSQRSAIRIPGSASVREPDLALYRQWEPAEKGWEYWKEVIPFWVAETISKGQEKRDYQDKRHDYWLAGIDEYWIVDRDARRVTVLTRGPDDWVETVFAEQQEAAASSLPGFIIPVARLIGSAKSSD